MTDCFGASVNEKPPLAGTRLGYDCPGSMTASRGLKETGTTPFKYRKAHLLPGSEARDGEPFAGSRMSRPESIDDARGGFNLVILDEGASDSVGAREIRQCFDPLTRNLSILATIRIDRRSTRIGCPAATGLPAGGIRSASSGDSHLGCLFDPIEPISVTGSA